MRTEGRRESANVEDRRRVSPKAAMGFGGGLIGLLVLLAVALLGGNPQQAAKMMEELNPPAAQQRAADVEFSPAEEEMARFVRVVLADTEDVWKQLFAERGAEYREPTLVLFSGRVQSACGFASAATGRSTAHSTSTSISTCRSSTK